MGLQHLSLLSHLTKWASGESRSRGLELQVYPARPAKRDLPPAMPWHWQHTWYSPSPVLPGCSAWLPRRALVPSSHINGFYEHPMNTYALRDRPVPLPFSFLRSIYLTCHSGDEADRTEVPHRHWSLLVQGQDQGMGQMEEAAESQREHEMRGHCLYHPCSRSSSSQPACPWLCQDPQCGSRNVLLLLQHPLWPLRHTSVPGVWVMGCSSGKGCW